MHKVNIEILLTSQSVRNDKVIRGWHTGLPHAYGPVDEEDSERQHVEKIRVSLQSIGVWIVHDIEIFPE